MLENYDITIDSVIALFQKLQLTDVIAFFALIVSIVSIYVALKVLRSQTRHNILTVKPLISIDSGDYEDHVYVALRNDGMGPLIIKCCKFIKNGKVYESLVETVDNLERDFVWNTFKGSVDIIRPQESVMLIEARFNQQTDDDIRNSIRDSLSDTSCSIEYTCLYQEKHPVYKVDLSWFSR
ncbi:TPA: hypothetical protein ACX3DA_004634 [Vibrio parahaemolyticus]